MYRARPNLCGIGAAANSRFCTLGTERRERSAARWVSAGARIGAPCKDWMMTSPGPGVPHDMQFCEGNEPPVPPLAGSGWTPANVY